MSGSLQASCKIGGQKVRLSVMLELEPQYVKEPALTLGSGTANGGLYSKQHGTYLVLAPPRHCRLMLFGGAWKPI
jgi:hypothetical protein